MSLITASCDTFFRPCWVHGIEDTNGVLILQLAFPEAELTYEKDDWLLRFQDGEFWIQSTKEINDEESVEDITGNLTSDRVLIKKMRKSYDYFDKIPLKRRGG